MSKDKGTKDEKGRNQGSSQSNKSLLEWVLASGKAGTWGCTISVNYPNNTMRYQNTGFSSETKSLSGGSKTVKRKWCCFHICLMELLSIPCTGKYQAVFKSRDSIFCNRFIKLIYLGISLLWWILIFWMLLFFFIFSCFEPSFFPPTVFT